MNRSLTHISSVLQSTPPTPAGGEQVRSAYEIALDKLRSDSTIARDNRSAELERYICTQTSLSREVVAEIVSTAMHECRRNRNLRIVRETRTQRSVDSSQVEATERAEPLPEACIRDTAAEWVNTLEPRGEWPRAFLFEEWRMIHSIAIARSAGVGRGKLRHPHCHDLLIGESGITHKNTSINRAASIIQIMRPEVLILSNVSSIEGVLEALHDKERSTALIASEEYSYLVATSQRRGTSNIVPVLNDMYDSKDPLTITRKSAPRIKNPFVNLVAGCTPAWIREYADREGADLGRFNRMTVFYADQDRNVFDPAHLTREEEEHFARLFADNLAKAITAPPAAISIDTEAHEWLRDWFLKSRRTLRSLADNLRKLIERDDDQLRIQSLIYAVAAGRRTINLDDVQAAAELVEWSRRNKMRLFSEIEFSAEQRLERRILKFIDRGGGTMTELYRYLGRDGARETVYRKLKIFVAEGSVRVNRPLDQTSREPLRLYRPDPAAI
jgi:Protein of unknown function (DUF3987)